MSEDSFLEAALAMRSRLYHVAMAILWNEQDAADAVQEAMLKAWKRRGSLRDESVFGAWLTRILVNQCRDLQRRLVRQRRLVQRAEAQLREGAGPSRGTEVFDAIHSLPDRLRLPVLLYYFDGYSQAEIAAITGATASQVKSRVRQGRDKLREILGGAEGAPRTEGGERDG